MQAPDEVQIRPLEPGEEDAVAALWQRCGLSRPWNDPHRDIQRKRAVQPDLLLVAVADGRVVGTVMVGYDGHRGWINYLAVDPDLQRRGLGRRLMQEAEQRLAAMGCPKVNLQVRTSNVAVLAFYRSIGYVQDDVVSLGKRMIDDSTSPGTPC